LTLVASGTDIAAPIGGIVVGAHVGLRIPPNLPSLLPHFHLIIGDEPFDPGAAPLTRVYLNVAPTYAAAVVHDLTTRLNTARIRFRMKILDDPVRYIRSDALVLYVPRDDWLSIAPLLESSYVAVATGVKPSTPAFTKRLAPGLAVADDPGGNQSFGQHRCGLLAEGIVRAWERRRRAIDRRFQVVTDVFAAAGIDCAAPFLNPGMIDVYEFPHEPTTHAWHRATPVGTPDAYLTVARDIANHLMTEALWNADRCTWIGASLSGTQNQSETLGPDVYDGTIGIAYFLAHLYRITGDPRLRSTALGATRQAFACLERVPTRVRLGLYTGWIGIALASVRIGAMLDEPTLIEAGRSLLGRVDDARSGEHEFDVMSGSAGAIMALLAYPESDAATMTGKATQLGDELLHSATRDNHGLSWPSTVARRSQHLTGYAHGASGIGLALLKLGVGTGAQRFIDAAMDAFAWERQWFDSTVGNWPDLRERPASRRRRGPLPYMTAWCHGAPGIGLARSRAWQLCGDERLRNEAVMALKTTRQSVETALGQGFANFSLCHGLAGNADILSLGSELPGEPVSSLTEIARDVAGFGRRYYAASGDGWPGGNQSGESPGLMLGLAGIGWFYLRIADPSVPSVLSAECFSI
jgi:hypothetical protein